MSIWGYGRERNGVLGNMLNTHPLALRHLMSSLMHFYIGKSAEFSANLHPDVLSEVEQTGASSQFYDKFSGYICISLLPVC